MQAVTVESQMSSLSRLAGAAGVHESLLNLSIKDSDERESKSNGDDVREASASHTVDLGGEQLKREKAKVRAIMQDIVKRVVSDKSRTETFEQTFASILDNDKAMFKCCRKLSFLQVIPKDRFTVLMYASSKLEKVFCKNTAVLLVQESQKERAENIKSCLTLACQLSVVNLIESSPDLERLTKTVWQVAPHWLEQRIKDLKI